jgi:heme exporter protein A
MLTCENLSVSINQDVILSKLNFTLLDKNCLVIKGKNGSCKSTLLKTLGGFLSPAEGKILWHGKSIHDDLALYQSTQISYLGHNLGLKNFLSARENLTFFAQCKGSVEIIEACLKYFGIEHCIDEPLCNLSKGTIKKIGLSRMMLSRSRIWLLDEPDNNLDALGKEMLSKLIDIKLNEGGIVVLTSHDKSINEQMPSLELEDYRL